MPVFELDFTGVKFTKGEYWLLAYPYQYDETNSDDRILTVAIDGVSISQFEGASYEEGMQRLSNALKLKALNKSKDSRKKVSENYSEFDDAYHVTDLGSNNCSYGFYYTKNASTIPLNLMFRTETAGFVPVIDKTNFELAM